MAYVITSSCIGEAGQSRQVDGAFPCLEACPGDGINANPGDRQLYVSTAECIDGGACEAACPIDALFLDYDVPVAVSLANAAHFAQFAS